MTTREMAMIWWKGLSSLGKTQICDLNTEKLGGVRRWETLTGREIEMLWNDKVVNEQKEGGENAT